jgi:hypothetical protein
LLEKKGGPVCGPLFFRLTVRPGTLLAACTALSIGSITRRHYMLKVNVLAAATAAALFAFGGAIAQSSTSAAATPSFSAIDKNNDGQISREEWNAYERSAKPAAGVRSDKQPTATTGPRDVGGSDKAKNPGAAAGTTGSGSGSTGAAAAGGTAAGSTAAPAASTGAPSSTDKAPTSPVGPKESGGTK